MAGRGDINNKAIQPELFAKWVKLKFDETLDKSGTFTKVKSKSYSDSGHYPVIDQGETFISGYINDDQSLYNGNLPVIIFGDHTRVIKYVDFVFAAGADGIFAEAVQTEEHYRAFTKALDVPVLANITEFGQTELWNKAQLGEWGCAMVLYPLSAFRAMNKAAESVYKTLLNDGDQKAEIENMQTRMDLYDYLGYHDYEQKLDSLFAEGKNK